MQPARAVAALRLGKAALALVSEPFFTAAICISDRSSAPRVRVRMSPGASPPITGPDSFFSLSCTMGRSGLGFSPA
eukprot:2351598-Prymnesium_polylepis.1